MRWALLGIAVAGCMAVPERHQTPPGDESTPPPGPAVVIPELEVADPEDRPAVGSGMSNDEEVVARPERFVAVAPSDASRLAIWTERTVDRSDDDAATLARVLDADMSVHDVVFDGTGRLWALVGGRLWVHTEDGRQSWQDLPFAIDADGGEGPVRPRLAAAQGRLAIAVADVDPQTLAVVHVSRNGGKTWSAKPVRSTVASSSIGVNAYDGLAIGKDGRLAFRVSWYQGRECAVAYDSFFDAHAGRPFAPPVEYADAPFDLHRAPDGWIYAACGNLESDPLCAAPPRSPGAEVDEPRWHELAVQGRTFSVVTGPDTTLAIADEQLWLLDAGRARRLAATVPDDAILRAVDALGRPWVESREVMFRWSPASGWTRLWSRKTVASGR